MCSCRWYFYCTSKTKIPISSKKNGRKENEFSCFFKLENRCFECFSTKKCNAQIYNTRTFTLTLTHTQNTHIHKETDLNDIYEKNIIIISIYMYLNWYTYKGQQQQKNKKKIGVYFVREHNHLKKQKKSQSLKAQFHFSYKK